MLRLILCAFMLIGWSDEPRLQAPSPQLQQQIRVWIEESVVDDALGSWPRRLMKERGLLLLHGNQAFLWYLSPEGQVFVLDTDRFGHRMEAETNLSAALNAVAQAVPQYPELAEMLPARPGP